MLPLSTRVHAELLLKKAHAIDVDDLDLAAVYKQAMQAIYEQSARNLSQHEKAIALLHVLQVHKALCNTDTAEEIAALALALHSSDSGDAPPAKRFRTAEPFG